MRVPAPIRFLAAPLLLVTLVSGLSLNGTSQTEADLRNYFRDSIGLNPEQIAGLRSGKAAAKILKSRDPDEIFVFGAVYIAASPESYIHLANDFDRRRNLPEFLSLGKFSDPPKDSDLEGFQFDADDIKALRDCKPGHCEVQMPAEAIETLHQSIDWDAANLEPHLNRMLHDRALTGLEAYKTKGNAALGVYFDKKNPVDVSQQFAYMLSYVQVLPRYLPDFHRYLLEYPNVKSSNIDDSFYWARVKFGLKPTLRVIQVVLFQGKSDKEPAFAIAEKQLYSSHYFETALDLTFCIRDPEHPKSPGFYLVKVMGSEQAGLTGVKGSLVRKVAIDRTASSLQKSLDAIRALLEQQP